MFILFGMLFIFEFLMKFRLCFLSNFVMVLKCFGWWGIIIICSWGFFFYKIFVDLMIMFFLGLCVLFVISIGFVFLVNLRKCVEEFVVFVVWLNLILFVRVSLFCVILSYV